MRTEQPQKPEALQDTEPEVILLPGVKVGNTWRLSKAALDAFVANGGRQ